uniref:Uncharacterized protein n=1 Tax=Physcomitrium patens TaxID=3218 RepID=A0A2K1IY12_PHYPA|nr:hypothetical protein PHYPA_023974 [Physcomitrium patens]
MPNDTIFPFRGLGRANGVLGLRRLFVKKVSTFIGPTVPASPKSESQIAETLLKAPTLETVDSPVSAPSCHSLYPNDPPQLG